MSCRSVRILIYVHTRAACLLVHNNIANCRTAVNSRPADCPTHTRTHAYMGTRSRACFHPNRAGALLYRSQQAWTVGLTSCSADVAAGRMTGRLASSCNNSGCSNNKQQQKAFSCSSGSSANCSCVSNRVMNVQQPGKWQQYQSACRSATNADRLTGRLAGWLAFPPFPDPCVFVFVLSHVGELASVRLLDTVCWCLRMLLTHSL